MQLLQLHRQNAKQLERKELRDIGEGNTVGQHILGGKKKRENEPGRNLEPGNRRPVRADDLRLHKQAVLHSDEQGSSGCASETRHELPSVLGRLCYQ